MNKQYLIYLFKERRIALVFFFILYLGLSLSPFLQNISMNARAETSFLIAVCISILLTFALPALLFAFVHRRRQADMMFALPLSRQEQLLTNIIFASAVSFVYFLITAAAVVLLGHSVIRLPYFLLFVLLAALTILELTCIHTCIYLIPNNTFDGLVMLAVYTCLPLLVYIASSVFTAGMVAGLGIETGSNLSLYLSPLYMNGHNLYTVCAAMIIPNPDTAVLSSADLSVAHSLRLLYIVIPFLMTIAACFLLRKHFINRMSERADQVSDDMLAYPLAIHICTFLALLAISVEAVAARQMRSCVFFYLLLLVIYIVSHFVYRRRITVDLKSLLIFFCMAVVSFGISKAAWMTRGFGRADAYTYDAGPYQFIEYWAQTDADDLTQPYDYTEPEREGSYLSINACIPADQRDRYSNTLEIFDQLRRESIDAYYSRTIPANSSYTLHLYNTDRLEEPTAIFNQYHYETARMLSYEELQAIAAEADVNVMDWQGNSYTLSEYLERIK